MKSSKSEDTKEDGVERLVTIEGLATQEGLVSDDNGEGEAIVSKASSKTLEKDI